MKTSTSLRRISAFYLSFCIILFIHQAGCQMEDDSADDELADVYNDEDDNSTEEDDLYIDNRIDATPTFISPVEKFMKAVMAPFGWISHANSNGTSNVTNESDHPQSDVEKFIDDLTKPIKDVVAPAGRAIQGGFGDVLNAIGDRFKAIYPGTEWCGAGSTAKSSKEIGLFKSTDSCCRAHDQCNNNLEAGATDRGLLNNGMFTRSHCLCDAKFYYCLKKARSIIATNIGFTYFNLLRPQCFKEEHPAYCIKYGRSRLRNNKCLEYDYDFNKNKTWQWFDSPDFL